MKTIVIYHSADFDGLFCREIARKHFGDKAEYLGWDYNQPEPLVPLDVDLVIMDLSVPSLMAHPRLVWIDHHRTAIEKYPADIPGLRIDGVAACRLAWQLFFGDSGALKADYVNHIVHEPLAVQLAGEYDVWDKRDPRAELFQHGLRSRNLDVPSRLGGTTCWDTLLTEGSLAKELVFELLEAGKILQYARRAEDASIIAASGFDVKFEGLQFLALNTARCNSLAFAAGLKPHHDACLAFRWDGRQWVFSLYGVPGRELIDLSIIATKYGGGGHKQACGFSALTLPWRLDAKNAPQLALEAYARYGAVTDFKNFRGDPMPEFGDLPDTIRRAWEAAANPSL